MTLTLTLTLNLNPNPNPNPHPDQGLASAQSLPAEQRLQLGRTLVAAANLLHASSPMRPPGL